MASIGSFGTPVPPAEDTFEYFGETIRVHPDLSDLALVDFAEEMDAVGDDGAKGLGVIRGLVVAMVHPEDFDRFWALAKRNRQGIEQVSTVATQVIESLSSRPTEQPSVSSDTPAPTEGDSSSRALTLLDGQGRGDLALMVLQAQQVAG